ncbi:mPR-like GPCR protein [Trichoderma guizhouense]|uniref:MPR-like GPCR protein n=1 Tax=Trichoderma guizhouense TaxID=1491466 RepID=A0A1T3CW83_9HYPO|nr:mPR-like GPCR protein [Trichoderma guizhouense]
MALYRRLSPTGRNETLDGASDSRDENVRGSKTTRRLLTAGEVPSWYAHNSYIRTGYRPVTNSAKLCFESLGYLHNETLNIYTHLVPAGIAVVGNYALYVYFSSHYPDASWKDQLVFHIYFSTSIICYGISSMYHMLLCHSETWSGLWARLDYTSIVFQILGSFISGIYIGFYCEPNLQKLYWTMIGTLGLLTGIVVVSPRLQSPKWRNLRVFAFVGTGLSAFAPIIHAATIFPYDQLDKQAGLRYYYLEGISILTGVVFYVTHFPESRIPEKFDIFGASHQIFHSFVVLGGAIHFYGILSAFDWNYNNPRCSL